MIKFPVDAPKAKIVKTLEGLGFRVIREGEHISMARENPDGSRSPLTMPNHPNSDEPKPKRMCGKSHET